MMKTIMNNNSKAMVDSSTFSSSSSSSVNRSHRYRYLRPSTLVTVFFMMLLTLVRYTSFYENDFVRMLTSNSGGKIAVGSTTTKHHQKNATHNTSSGIIGFFAKNNDTASLNASSPLSSSGRTDKNNTIRSTSTLLTPFDKKTSEKHNASNHQTTIATKILQDARYPNGSYGYIADPTSCRYGRKEFLQQRVSSSSPISKDQNDYWTVLELYESHLRHENYNGDETASQKPPKSILTDEYICAPGPGRGPEKDGGYKMLVEKIQVYQDKNEKIALNYRSNGSATQNTTKNSRSYNKNKNNSNPIKILCAVYTYPRMRDLLRTTALSWGYKCDGFLAFSNETIPSIGLVDLPHEGVESYQNMWQKTRSIWAYIGKHYLSDYDFFHLGGDDMYVIVENLRKFLQDKKESSKIPMLWGQWYLRGPNNGIAVSGGPGYTLNRAALSLFLTDIFPRCDVHYKTSAEDGTLSKCFRTLGITPEDTRDSLTGEQTYHGVRPDDLYTSTPSSGNRGSFQSKNMAFWATLPHPTNISRYIGSPSKQQQKEQQLDFIPVGPKIGLEAAAKFSIALHQVHAPHIMARMHALLYKSTCPVTSPLGRALRSHATVMDNQDMT